MITIKRIQLAPRPGSNPRFAWKWLYSYGRDGNFQVYGTHLAALRNYLKRTYPNERVTESWKGT